VRPVLPIPSHQSNLTLTGGELLKAELATSLSSEAVDLLWYWGIALDAELKILVCFSCKQGIKSEPEKIVCHLQALHSKKGQPIKTKHPNLLSDLEHHLRGFHFARPSSVRHQPAGRAPIPGVEIYGGYYCPATLEDGTKCSRAYPEVSTLYEHVKKAHEAGNRRNKTELEKYPCDCQTIFRGNARRYFRVKTGLLGLEDGPENSVNPYSVFVGDGSNETNSDPKVIEKLRNEELPSLLRATQWHVFLGERRKGVVEFIDHPDRYPKGSASPEEKVLAMLPDVCDAWLTKIGYYWRGSTESMKRALDGYPMYVPSH
jgi:hypothetical protein